MERPRCVHCRNPIKESHKAAGPTPGDRSYHEDCWNEAGAVVVPQQAAADQQRAYEEQIASHGLAALLSPYVSKLPEQRSTAPRNESVTA